MVFFCNMTKFGSSRPRKIQIVNIINSTMINILTSGEFCFRHLEIVWCKFTDKLTTFMFDFITARNKNNYSWGLSTATIEYSHVCLCVCLCT